MCHRMLAALAAFTVFTASAAPLNDTIIEGVIPTLPPTIAQKQLETGCAAPCSKHLMETLRTLMKPGNNSLLMDEACQQYDDARECMQRLPHCSSGRAFEVVTSGLQFMCVDQRDAFNAVIDCVDENSDSVHGECEASCRVNSALAAFSMKDALTQGFGAIKKAIDANMIRMVMNEGCRISQCLLKCHKVKFNARCQGSAGTLLAEVFVRPFALGSRSMSPMNSLLRLFVPDKCAYLLDPASLQELRIDPELEAELRRMYSQPKSSVDVAPAKADIGVSSQVVNGLVEGLSNNVGHTRTEVIKVNKAKVTTQDAKGVKIEGGKVEGSVITRRLEDLQEVEDGSEIAWTEGSSSGGDITEASASGDVELFSGEFSGEGTGDGSGEDLLDYQEHSGEARGDSIPQIDPKTGDRVLKMTRMKDGSADLFLAQRIDPDIPYVLRMLVPQRDRGELVCVLQTDRGFERQVADGRWPLLKDEENH